MSSPKIDSRLSQTGLSESSSRPATSLGVTNASVAPGSPEPLRSTSVLAGKIADRFAGFHSVLSETTQAKKHEEESRYVELRERTAKSEDAIVLESKRRQEAVRALQTMLEGRLTAVAETIQSDMRARFETLSASIETLTSRVISVEKKMEETTQAITTELENASGLLKQQVQETQVQLDQERTTRVERETKLVKKLGDDMFRLQERIDQERVGRESAISQVATEIQAATSARKKGEERFQTHLVEQINHLKEQLAQEAKVRAEGEAALNATLEDLVSHIQNSLSIVGR